MPTRQSPDPVTEAEPIGHAPATTFAALGVWMVLAAGFPAAASAQPPARSFQELQARVGIGDRVVVVDQSNVETRGQVQALSDVSIGIAVDGSRRDFVESAISRIDRLRRDSVRNGLLLGLGGGALVGFLAGRAADSPTCPRSGVECGQGAALGTVAGAMWGGVGGWLIDVLHRRREVVYLPPAGTDGGGHSRSRRERIESRRLGHAVQPRPAPR